MKRIAIISDHASPLAQAGQADSGGQNIYVKNIALALAGKGVHVDIFTRKDSPALPRVISMAPRVNVIHLKAGAERFIEKETLLPHMGEFTDSMQTYLKTSPPYDLIHANFFMSGLVARRIKQWTGCPFCITFHALGRIRRLHQKEEDRFPDERFEIEDEIIHSADGIIAECPQDREDLLMHYSADPAKIIIIPCGVDIREMHPVRKENARNLLHIGKEEKIILHLGRLVRRKGVETIIRALPHLKKNHGIRVKFLVVGGPPFGKDLYESNEIQALERVAGEAGVLADVEFRGMAKRKETRLYYSSADIFISTPWYEPFGITVIEAMACKTAVIGSNVGGLKYSIEHGKSGLLIPPKDPEALARAIAFLFENEGFRNECATTGRTRVLKQFTWNSVGNSLLGYFKNIQSKSLDPVP